MTAYDILKKFGEYIKYDPGQTSFNMLSSNYIYHQAGDRITTLCDLFDPSGRMAVLYAKRTWQNVNRETRIKLSELLEHREQYEEAVEMYNLFNSNEVLEIENDYIEALNSTIRQITGNPMLGERDIEKEKEVIYEAIEGVSEQLERCGMDVYINSGAPVQKVDKISSKILLFNYMAECVLTLQSHAPDGAYLCYINNNGTADGYFAIMIRSNGNLFSVHDRVSETYIGQHTRSRNGRWAEAHKDIFPYEYVMSFDNYDYLGYAQKYNIDESKLNLADLSPEAYIPIILSIICVVNAEAGKILDPAKQVYMNTLIQSNVQRNEEKNALIAMDKTGLIDLTTKKLEFCFDKEKLLRGEYNKEIDNFHSCGCNQGLVDLYGGDFEPKAKTLTMTAQNVLMSGNDEDSTEPHAEFVASVERMRRQAYYETRLELSKHIEERLAEELKSLGGTIGLQKWFYGAMKENIRKFYPTLARIYADKNSAKKSAVGLYAAPEGTPEWMQHIYIVDDAYYYPDNGQVFNDPHREHIYGNRYNTDYFYCPITGTKANIWFCFRSYTWQDIEAFTGKQVINILRGWKSRCYGAHGFERGNPILDAVDAVDFIDPFGSEKNSRYVKFDYYIGFSKRGLNRLMKENGIKIVKEDQE